jgi:hypothetical protein
LQADAITPAIKLAALSIVLILLLLLIALLYKMASEFGDITATPVTCEQGNLVECHELMFAFIDTFY